MINSDFDIEGNSNHWSWKVGATRTCKWMCFLGSSWSILVLNLESRTWLFSCGKNTWKKHDELHTWLRAHSSSLSCGFLAQLRTCKAVERDSPTQNLWTPVPVKMAESCWVQVTFRGPSGSHFAIFLSDVKDCESWIAIKSPRNHGPNWEQVDTLVPTVSISPFPLGSYDIFPLGGSPKPRPANQAQQLLPPDNWNRSNIS